MKKLLKIILATICLCAGLSFIQEKDIQAASYKLTGEKEKIGSYFIWVNNTDGTLRVSKSSSGSGKVIAKKPSGKYGYMSGPIITNGSTIFYTCGNWNEGGWNYIYKINVTGKSKVLLRKSKTSMTLDAYYNGYLYLDTDTVDDCTLIHLASIKVSTKSYKIVKKNASFYKQYKNYLICMPNTGDFSMLPIYLYNMSTRKCSSKLATGCTPNISGGKLYYAYTTYSTYSSSKFTFKIIRCDLNGKNKKTVVSKLRAGAINKITNKYVYFSNWSGLNTYEYRYDIKNKSTKLLKKN